MFSNAKLVSVGVIAMGLSACAGVGTAGRGGTEVRGMAAINAESPRAIAEGPVHLLHVDVHGQQAVTLFSVVRRSGTDRDCWRAGLRGALCSLTIVARRWTSRCRTARSSASPARTRGGASPSRASMRRGTLAA